MSVPLRIGMHASIAGGLANAARTARDMRCDCFQIFSRNPRGWKTNPLTDDDVAILKSVREEAGLWPLATHSVYLINLAATDETLLARSREAFREEITRGISIGADYLVVHPGNPVGASADFGIDTAIESIKLAAKGLKMGSLSILIENTAGQGTSIGCRFDQVAEIIAGLDGLPVGVCLDTAHTLASGYDISSEKGLKQTIREIDRSFGFDRIKLIHCNDSKVPLGSRVDRHQHIGLGYIGDEAFRRLTHNLKFRRTPLILETPVDKERDYDWNLNRIRELSDGKSGDQTEKPAARARGRVVA